MTTPPRDTPELIAELRALAVAGTTDPVIARRLGLGEATVARYRRRYTIPAGRYVTRPLEVDPPAPVVTRASRAELVAAARPWAQRPWSAKGGA